MTNAARKLPLFDSALESRLKAWADEYGGSRYENIGYPSKNMLQTLSDHRGEPPSGGGHRRTLLGTAADEVEQGVQLLVYGKGTLRSAMILRMEYFRPDLPRSEKHNRLTAINCGVSKPGYDDELNLARDFIADHLRGIKCKKSS